MKASQVCLEPVYEQVHRELLKRDVLHADETTLQVLHEPGKEAQSKSYMWLYRTSGDTDKPVVMYEYQPSRGAAHPKEFLEGFSGYLHTDGYAGYHNLPENITVVGCWAHLRRKFDEAMKSLPKGKARTVLQLRDWLTAPCCLRLRRDWKRSHWNKDINSGWNRQNLF